MADNREGHDAAQGSSIPHPEDPGAQWDRVKLGPYVLPGTWVVSGAAGRDVDVKKSKGKDGARFRDQGYDPAPLTLNGQLNGASEWNEMVKAAKVLTPRKRGVAMEPLACEHPALTFLGITNILVKKVHAPVAEDGFIRCAIEIIEWMPEPKKKKAPTNTPLSVGSFASGDLQRQARATPWQVSPADQYNTDNLDADILALPGFEPTP